MYLGTKKWLEVRRSTHAGLRRGSGRVHSRLRHRWAVVMWVLHGPYRYLEVPWFITSSPSLTTWSPWLVMWVSVQGCHVDGSRFGTRCPSNESGNRCSNGSWVKPYSPRKLTKTKVASNSVRGKKHITSSFFDMVLSNQNQGTKKTCQNTLQKIIVPRKNM